MASNPKLLDRVLGQLEASDANTRGIALDTALRMLKAEGLTFRDLHASHRALVAEREAKEAAAREERARAARAAAQTPKPSAPRPAQPRPAQTRRPEPAAPPRPKRSDYTNPDGTARALHKPRVGMFTREVGGKRVVRNTRPPSGAVGVLRVLKDRIVGRGAYGPKHVMVLSFETDDVLYEPYVHDGEIPAWVEQTHRLSHTGAHLRM